jgi:hypothetical protein
MRVVVDRLRGRPVARLAAIWTGRCRQAAAFPCENDCRRHWVDYYRLSASSCLASRSASSQT